MKRLQPPAIYIHERVKQDHRALARAERLLSIMDSPKIVSGITDDELAKIVQEAGWRTSRRVSGAKKAEDPTVILNAFDFDQPDGERAQGNGDLYYGGGAWARRDRKRVFASEGTICQDAWEIHSALGCLFKCDYCALENVLNLMVNIEAFVEHLGPFIDAHAQTLYKWDSRSDILTFEPEYDATRPMVEFFGAQRKAFLMHYTKSDNVDVLRDLKHHGQTMVCWSLSAHTQSRLIEVGTATDEERIEAMRKCQEWGYHVRCRLSPIVPVANWREENRALLELLFSRVQPEVISLETLAKLKLLLVEEKSDELLARLRDGRLDGAVLAAGLGPGKGRERTTVEVNVLGVTELLTGLRPALAAAACPFCVIMLEEAGQGSLPIKDIAEVIAKALEVA